MKNWLIKELAKINRTSPKSANKPIFITGHSLGGALANLIMYSLLEHNYSTKNPNSRLNLKALYTFGTPRVGDQVWAKRLHELAEQNNVGLYRIVNFSDPVPSLPCINYSHGGALVYMSLNPDGFSNSNSVEVILNPLKRVLNTNNSHINLANCAYETALYYPLRIKEMLDSHFMTSYYQSLSFLKNTLNKKLQIRKNQALLNQDYKAAEQLTYPLNCQKPNISNLSLDGVDLNYQLLKNGSEN